MKIWTASTVRRNVFRSFVLLVSLLKGKHMIVLFRQLRPAACAAAITCSMFVAATSMLAWADSAPVAQQELDWARAALGRNDALEVVASDPATGWITVRVKSTGELRKVFAGSVVAMLPGDAPIASPAGSDEGATASAKPAAVPAAPKGERVLLSGPGYSIAAASSASDVESRSASATAPATGTGAGASIASGLPLEHLHEPIICQGAQLLHIDSRNLEFDGNALSVQNGCELHITNSRIVAKGVGVNARAASVHIDNSSIAGESGSVEASDGAQVYASSSTFKGLIRRLDTAAFHDMGGNVGD
jgi:hypothetical protein